MYLFLKLPSYEAVSKLTQFLCLNKCFPGKPP